MMTPSLPDRARLLGLCLVLAAHVGGVVPGPAGAATFVVNSVADTDNGACATAAAGCTLREAITAANAAAGRDTITFDPTVFTLGTPQTIAVQSALPHLAEPAGNVVDSRGAGVVIDGAALDPMAEEDGLVIESGSAQPLDKVAVRHVAVANFPGSGVLICGGVPPECAAEISNALVSTVTATTNGLFGIAIEGRPNVGTRVEDSVATGNQIDGIRVNSGGSPGTDLVKATVEGCSAFANAARGINLNASRDNVAPKVTGSVAVENGGTGINVNAGRAVFKPRVSQSVSSSNGSGIVLNAGSAPDVTNATVKDNTAAGNVSDGITAEGSANKLVRNRATGNGGVGIVLRSPGGGNKIEKNRVGANGVGGITVRDGNGSNRIKQNVALGNGTDLVDDAAGCDANTWQKNVFSSASQPCIQ